MVINPNIIFKIDSEAQLKDRLFELMLHQDSYPFGEAIMQILYGNWTVLVYRENDGTLTLCFHHFRNYPELSVSNSKHFFSMGVLCSFILDDCLKIKL